MINRILNLYYSLLGKYTTWQRKREERKRASPRPRNVIACYACNGEGIARAYADQKGYGLCDRCFGLGLE